MSKHYRTILKFESELSKTTAELRNDTEVILDGFDGDPMSSIVMPASKCSRTSVPGCTRRSPMTRSPTMRTNRVKFVTLRWAR